MVDTNTAFDQAEALSIVLRREVDAIPGYVVTDQTLALGVLRTSMGCPKPIDAACEARIAKDLNAKRIVWAHLELVDRDVEGALHFYQEGRGSSSVPLKYAANLKEPADDTLIDLARKALAAAGATAPKGRLKIDAPGVSGDVYVGDEKIGVLQGGFGRFDAPSGAHRVVVRSADGTELASDVNVVPWNETAITLTRPPPEGPGLDPKIFIGFGAIAAGVGFGIAGLYSSLKVLDNQDVFDTEHRGAYADTINACDAPNGNQAVISLCESSEKHVAFQAVFYPIAGVAAAAGVTLLALSDWGGDGAKTEALVVLPIVSPETAGVVVGSRF